MAAIKFDITGDNSGFIESINQIQQRVRQTSSVLSEVGKNFNIEGVANQIISLTKIIQDNENEIIRSKERVAKWLDQANDARNEGDNSTFEIIQKDIEEETRSLSQLITETKKYKDALTEIQSLNGLGSGSKAPMFFENQSGYEAYEEMLRKREEIQSKIANFDSEGMSESQATKRIVEMRSELTVLNAEINKTELAAANAASALGENGEKASEAAVRYFELNRAVEDQIAKINDLQLKLNEAKDKMVVAVNNNDAEGARDAQIEVDAYAESLHGARMELINLQGDQKQAEQAFKEYGDTSVSLRMQLREVTMELQSLTLQYREMTSEERSSAAGQEMKEKMESLIDKAGELRDAMDDVNASVRAASSDTSAFDAMAGGVNVVTSSIGAATGVMAMLGVEEEDLLDIQAKLQASLAISNALTVVQNNLQKESALMLGISNIQRLAAAKAIDMENAAKGRGVIATAALTAAQKAFNIVANANPYVLLATAIVTVVGAIALYSSASRKAKREEEELAKAQEEAAQRAKESRDAFVNASVEAMNTASKISNLQVAYKKASSEIEKTNVLKQAQSEFKKLGIACNSLTDAQNILVKQGGAVVEMLRLQGTVAALSAMRMEAYKKSFSNILENGGDVNYAATLAGSNSMVVELDKQIANYSSRVTNLKSQLGIGNGSGGSKTTGGVSNQRSNIIKEEQRYQEELSKIKKQGEDARKDAVVASIQDEGEREYAERKAQHEKALRDISEQTDEIYKAIYERRKKIWESTHKGSYEDTPEGKKGWSAIEKDGNLTSEEQNYFNARYQIVELNLSKENILWDRYNENQQEQLIRSMQDYLVEYGNYQQKKKAIAEKYSKEIAKAEGDPGKQLMLKAEERRKQAELDMKAVQESIDWEVVFGNLNNLSKKALEKLRDDLRTALSNTTDPENAKILSEKLLEVEDRITVTSSMWASMIPALRERAQIENQVALAAEREAKANQEYLKAYSDLSVKQWNAQRVIEQNTGKQVSSHELSTKSIEDIMKTVGLDKDKDPEKYKAVSKALGELKVSAENAARATADLAKAKTTKESWNQIFKGTDGGILKAWKDAWKEGGVFGVAGLGAQNIGEMGSLAETLGFSGDDFEKISTGVNDAMGAVTDFASGNYIGALTKGISAINSLGEGIGLWSNSNVAEMEAMIDRLEKSNDELGKALDDLRDEMHNTNLADTDAYERAQRVANAQIENGMRVVWAKMNEYDGHHSTRYYSDYATSILKAIAQRAMNEGVINRHSLGNDSEINGTLEYLTPEELDKLRTFDPEGWIKFMDALRDADKADLGAADTFLEYVDTYADTLKDLEIEWKETLLNLSWDSLKSSFASALEDMEKSVEDWNDDLTDIFKKGVSNYISTKYTDKNTGDLAKWYEKYYEAMNSNGLDVNEVKALREDYLRIVSEATAERDNLYRTLGITEQDKQSAMFNSAQNITYEQADAIAGILTAQLIVQEQGNVTRDLIQQNLATMRDFVTGRLQELSEIRNLIIDGNNTRETMLKVMKEHFGNFTTQMNRIVTEIQNQ